jgi:hypothetical protein
MLMNGKPLFFDADHVSGYANAVLLNDFMAKMNEVRLQQRL